jgi:(4S)-4-hydroxy-5-phosphonooxypentane-2,3-dione isomerase
MPKFSTVGTIEVARGLRDELLPLPAAHKARCLKDESGTVQFEILLPQGDDTKVLLYEVYRDAAAFDVHRNGPSFARWKGETAALVAKLYGTRCTVLD